MNAIVGKVLALMSEEVNKTETQALIKRKVIIPVINMIYAELYPYIIVLMITILVILLVSILTFVGFVMTYLKKL